MYAACPPLVAQRPVLFLDFDGVVQTPALSDWLDMEHCGGLRTLLSAVPELDVVVTSTHREGRALESVRALLPEDIAPRVTGATPVTPMGRADGGRQAEIETWLELNGGHRLWVAVDDETHLYRPGCPTLVSTNKYIGWNDETTYKLLQHLRCASHQAPMRTGMRAAPSWVSASQRCLPSTNSKASSPAEVSTGSAGQSFLVPLAQSLSQLRRNSIRNLLGVQGTGYWDAACKAVTSIKTSCTGFFTNP